MADPKKQMQRGAAKALEEVLNRRRPDLYWEVTLACDLPEDEPPPTPESRAVVRRLLREGYETQDGPSSP